MPMSFKSACERLDLQILEYRMLLETQLAKEYEEDRHTLLLSRGIKYRLENLERKRYALQRKYTRAPDKIITYRTEMLKREKELDTEQQRLQKYQEELTALQTDQVTTLAVGNFSMAHTKSVLLKDKYNQIRGQKTRVRNKERALENWIAKEAYIDKVLENEIKFATTEFNIRTKEQLDGEKPLEVEKQETKNTDVNKTTLAQDINWNKPAFDNSILDMLSQEPPRKIDTLEDIVYDDSIFVKTTPKVQID